MLVLDGGRIGLVDFGLVGKLTDEDMARLTRLFIDAATENVDALPRRLAELGVRYPKEREDEFAAELRELFYRYYGASLADIDPIQVIREGFALIYSMNLRADAVRPARQGDRDARRRRGRALPGLQRLRGRTAVRARADGGAVLAVTARDARAEAGPRALRDRERVAVPGARRAQEIRDGQIEVGFVHKGLDEFMHKLDVIFNRLVIALVVAGGLLARR